MDKSKEKQEQKMMTEFLGRRLAALREKNHVSQKDMAKQLDYTNSMLSKVEKGSSSYRNTCRLAQAYCSVLGLSKAETDSLLRGEKAAVVDTSALIRNLQLIEWLSEEYGSVIVPKTVMEELDHIKDKNKNGLGDKAWQVIAGITNAKTIRVVPFRDDDRSGNNDSKILALALQISKELSCPVDIITNDVGFAARLKGSREEVRAVKLDDYIAGRQAFSDMERLKKIDAYYADSYDDIETQLKIRIPGSEELNAYLANGNTLIISAVRQKKEPLSLRMAKIRWLVKHGADVNKRDRGRYNFPPLTHVIQVKSSPDDLKMFRFLLREMHADPNVGSRDPANTGHTYRKNEGNMPLMVAAWHGYPEFVRELCQDARTSLNQQDANGYTALIKACFWGNTECRTILTKAGADTKIVDRDGFTAEMRYQEFLRTGRRKGTFNARKKQERRDRQRQQHDRRRKP